MVLIFANVLYLLDQLEGDDMGSNNPKGDGTERRQHKRRDHQIRVGFKLDSDETVIEGETYNLSPAGAYCRVNRPIAEMTRLMILLDLPNGQVNCEGTVVRSEQKPLVEPSYEIAIFFHRIDEEASKRLQTFLHS